MFETRGRSSPRRWPLWKGCELCGHNLKLHDEKGRCPVCRENARRSRRWSPCYEIVSVELPAWVNEFLKQMATRYRVSVEELTLIMLEVDYYCDHVLGLSVFEIDDMIGELAKKGDMSAIKQIMRKVTEEEKKRITEGFALLLEKDGFLRKVVRKHAIPAPSYIAVFHHTLLVKAHYLPGVAEALERRVESLDQD